MNYHLVHRFLFEFVGITDSFTHLVLPLRVQLHFYHKKCRVYSGRITDMAELRVSIGHFRAIHN